MNITDITNPEGSKGNAKAGNAFILGIEGDMWKDMSRFLSAFFPVKDEEINFRAFRAKGAPKSPDNYPIKKPITRAHLESDVELQQELLQLNETRGMYFVVNSGGDDDESIIIYNACFAEIDNKPISEQHELLDAAPIQPSIRVETRKSVHAYWLLKPPSHEKAWRDMQGRLIEYFKSDRSIKNPSRTMRLPFFNHVRYMEGGEHEYKRVKLVHFEPNRRYSLEEMKDAFPPVPVKERERQASALLDGEYIPEGQRNSTLASLAGMMRNKGMSREAIEAALMVENENRCDPPLDDDEVASIAESISRYEAGSIDSQSGLAADDDLLPLSCSWRDFSSQEYEEAEKVIFELEHGEVGMLVAATNIGKTTLALNTALMLAAGGEFAPLVEKKEGGRRVLVIDGESRRGRLQRDIQRMLKDWNSDEIALVDKNFHVMCDSAIGEEPLNLSNERHVRKIIAEAKSLKPDLIIIDTLSALFSLRSENDNAEVADRVMKPLASVAKETGAAVLLIHHIGKQSEDAQAGVAAYRGRGASATGTFARLVLVMNQDKIDRDRVVLTCAKSKGRRFEDTSLKLDPVAGSVLV